MSPMIRFPQGLFSALRTRLLADLDRESFAVLFGKRERAGEVETVRVLDVRFPGPEDYRGRGLTHLGLEKGFIHGVLRELSGRLDADTLLDVHTHPFCATGAAFSAIDDRDERTFRAFLHRHFPDLHYGSIVLSRADQAARLWRCAGNGSRAQSALIRTPTALEMPPSATVDDGEPEFLARTRLTLGTEVMREIGRDRHIAIVGVGGLGSLVAENLTHMGFNGLHLIDPDTLELSNLNRIVGATHADAVAGRSKVAAVADHLRRIRPDLAVTALPAPVQDEAVAPVLARADWILLCTDNHFSRFHVQQMALRHGVPLVSVGVNITVTDGRMHDMSGEVITIRPGDNLCLNCLGRLDSQRIAVERSPDGAVGRQLVQRGYVTGMEVKEPAVKTLNAILAALAVDQLINQFSGRQPHVPVLVYENNRQPSLYADTASVTGRNLHCFSCHVTPTL